MPERALVARGVRSQYVNGIEGRNERREKFRQPWGAGRRYGDKMKSQPLFIKELHGKLTNMSGGAEKCRHEIEGGGVLGSVPAASA
jgi:hypothetical protein